MSTKRFQHSKKIKFEAALALISEKQTLAELSQKYGVHQSVLQRWKKGGEPCGLDINCIS